jgi:hypothetical protein
MFLAVVRTRAVKGMGLRDVSDRGKPPRSAVVNNWRVRSVRTVSTAACPVKVSQDSARSRNRAGG